MQNRPGIAILALVLLVSALGLSGSVSYLTSKRSSLRDTTSNVQRNQALACAESAVDIAKQCMRDHTTGQSSIVKPNLHVAPNCPPKADTALDASQPSMCTYAYALAPITDQLIFPVLSKDKTEIVVLKDGATQATSFTMTWKTDFAAGNVIEVNLLKVRPGGGYDVTQTDYSCAKVPSSGLGKSATPAAYVANTNCSQTVAVSGHSVAQITTRISDASDINITIAGGAPLQGYQITAGGKAGEAQRTVIVAVLDSEAYRLARMFNNAVYFDSTP